MDRSNLAPDRLMIIEDSGKWTQAIRLHSRFDPGWSSWQIERCLDIADLVRRFRIGGQEGGHLVPATAILVELDAHHEIARFRDLSRRDLRGQWACWCVVPESWNEFKLLFMRAGAVDVVSSLSSVPRLIQQIDRFFHGCAPVDWPLELRIEQQMPWRPVSTT